MLCGMSAFPRLVAMAILALLAACAGRTPTPSASPGQHQPAQCLARLDQLGVRYAPGGMPASGNSACAVENPVAVSAATIAWNPPGLVSCSFALALESFARDIVLPTALRHFGKRVVAMQHLGAYSCRREAATGRWSQHAAGTAIDIAGFALEDGTVVSVEREWRKPGPKRDFLRDVAHQACGRFGLVLTPDSDAEHYNHIHLDLGPYRRCGA